MSFEMPKDFGPPPSKPAAPLLKKKQPSTSHAYAIGFAIGTLDGLLLTIPKLTDEQRKAINQAVSQLKECTHAEGP